MKWSNFLVTVNLNASAANSDAVVSELIDGVYGMASSEWLWEWLRKYENGSRVRFEGEDKQLVERVRLRVALEEGGTQNQSLHAHILVEVQHRTMVQVDYRGIKDVFTHYTGANPNVNVKFIKGSGEERDYILKYITKEVPPRSSKRALNTISRVFDGTNANIYETQNNYPV